MKLRISEYGFAPALFILILASFIFLSFNGHGWAGSWHVSPSGDDENGDGSPGLPYRTISKAISEADAHDTIFVGDDDDSLTVDYPETFKVEKPLVIQAADEDETRPQIALVSSAHIIEVKADEVTIRGLEVYGAIGTQSCAIFLYNDSSNCIITDNQIGRDASHGNTFGILLGDASDNLVTCNYCYHNTQYGILVRENSNNNVISENTCLYNGKNGISISDGATYNRVVNNEVRENQESGIRLDSADHNLVQSNRISENGSGWFGVALNGDFNTILSNQIGAGHHAGIEITGNSNSIVYNTITGNTIGLLSEGMFPDEPQDNQVVMNMFDQNATGISLSGATYHHLYLNVITGVSQVPAVDNGTGNYWSSPVKLGYAGKRKTYKGFLGNYYPDYTGIDNGSGGRTAGDGVGDTNLPYVKNGVNDSYPLMSVDSFAFDRLTFGLSENSELVDGLAALPEVVTLPAGGNGIWVTAEASPRAVEFVGGESQDLAWTGQLTFDQAPASGSQFTITIGFANDSTGGGFQPAGPTALAEANGSISLVFSSQQESFTLPGRKHLAVKISNDSTQAAMLFLGGSRCFVSTPRAVKGLFRPIQVPYILLLME